MQAIPKPLGDSMTAFSEVAATLQNISFRYNSEGKLIIKDASLALGTGEIVSIIGPSGCGKSTLLRIISGLLKPTSGTVRISEPPEKSAERPPCTMVFQEDTLLPWLRLDSNVRLAFKYRGIRSREANERASQLINMVGLTDSAKSYPYQLSGGMRRRATVVAAVAPLPRLLLLDEPFSALDEPTRIQLHGDLYRLFREFGITTLLVTHDIGEAVSLSDRVLVMSRPPSAVVWQCHTGLGDERDMNTIRTTDKFLSLYGDLWRELNQAGAGQGERTK